MLEGLYFLKGKSGTTSAWQIVVIILVVALLLCGAGTGYWYYFIKLPANAAIIQQQQAAQKLRNDISSVHDWYEKSLAGIDIDSAIQLLNELHRSVIPLFLAAPGIDAETYSCSTKSCDLSFKMTPDAILTQPMIVFFRKTYAASFPVKQGKGKSDALSIEYNKMQVALPDNDMLKLYKRNKPLTLYSCNDVISYIKTYNSALALGKNNKKNGEIVFKSLPKSTVSELESKLSGQVKSYGMLLSEWNMEIRNPEMKEENTEILMQMALYKQTYRGAFLIRKIETANGGVKVSGGLVCKA